MLAALKDKWRGTLVLIGQPAEEKVDGARAMLADGLYTRFPKPDYALALHDSPELLAGKIGYISGYMLAGSRTVDVSIRGRGGHGAYPHKSKDPVVMAAEYILAIQTIVSREDSPLDPAVVSVGSIHGGTKHNIIPDEVHLQITVRAYKEEVMQHILASLDRIAKGVAFAAGIPANLAPIVRVSETEVTQATYNNPALTTRVVKAMKAALAADDITEIQPVMGSEDFGELGLEGHQIPTMMFRVGAIDAERIAKSKETGVPLPATHSSLFWPAPEATMRGGVVAMTAALLDLMKR